MRIHAFVILEIVAVYLVGIDSLLLPQMLDQFILELHAVFDLLQLHVGQVVGTPLRRQRPLNHIIRFLRAMKIGNLEI